MSRVITFGEILLRLTAPRHQRFIQAQSFAACYGGSEANAAVSLCNYGTSAEFVTRLPAHALGQAAIDSLRARGAGTRYIVRGGDRLGVYYVEQGAGYRGQTIVYDRAGSAIAEAAANEFDWKHIFTDSGAEWFHFSGITPALSDTCAALCLSACRAAKRLGLTVSCDLNYREALWSQEKPDASWQSCADMSMCASPMRTSRVTSSASARPKDCPARTLPAQSHVRCGNALISQRSLLQSVDRLRPCGGIGQQCLLTDAAAVAVSAVAMSLTP